LPFTLWGALRLDGVGIPSWRLLETF